MLNNLSYTLKHTYKVVLIKNKNKEKKNKYISDDNVLEK